MHIVGGRARLGRLQANPTTNFVQPQCVRERGAGIGAQFRQALAYETLHVEVAVSLAFGIEDLTHHGTRLRRIDTEFVHYTLGPFDRAVVPDSTEYGRYEDARCRAQLLCQIRRSAELLRCDREAAQRQSKAGLEGNTSEALCSDSTKTQCCRRSGAELKSAPDDL